LGRALHEIALLKQILLAAASSIDVNFNTLVDAGISEVLRWPLASAELAAASGALLAHARMLRS
jgi:hypothetical protein